MLRIALTRRRERPVRVFVAVPLPADLKSKLALIQDTFRTLPFEATWVRMEGFHITLKFLGEVKPIQIEGIVSALRDAVTGYGLFSLRLGGMGVFPNEANPKVLWVGVVDGAQHLGQLQRSVDSYLEHLGFQPEGRRFTPHLTIARFKRVAGRSPLVDHLKMHHRTVFGEIEVHQLELVESQLHPSGARYVTLNTVHLSDARGTSKWQEGWETTTSFEGDRD